MKPQRTLLLIVLTMLMITSCSTKRYAYVADAPREEQMPITNVEPIVIAPDDQLYIHVGSQYPTATVAFNQETNRRGIDRGNRRTFTSSKQPIVLGYLVTQNGDIIFPILGRIHVAGMTLDSLSHTLEQRLIDEGYITDPVVTINLMNFHVTVIGEVKKPHTLFPSGTRITIFEAIAQCGDITLDGIPEKVVVVRNENNLQIVDTVDLTRREVLESPYYYLHQNDIVFVEPTDKKKRTAYTDEDWLKYVTTGTHIVKTAWQTIYHIQKYKDY